MNYNILVCGCSASSADAPRIPDMSNVHLLSIKPWATKQCKVIATSGFEAHCSWTFGGHTWVRLWSRWLPKLFSVGDPILNLYCACRCTAGLVSRGLTWALGWLVFWGLGCEEIDEFHSSHVMSRLRLASLAASSHGDPRPYLAGFASSGEKVCLLYSSLLSKEVGKQYFRVTDK